MVLTYTCVYDCKVSLAPQSTNTNDIGLILTVNISETSCDYLVKRYRDFPLNDPFLLDW